MRFLAIGYNIEDDFAVSDVIELEQSCVGETPSQEDGAAQSSVKQLRASRSIGFIDRIWLVDPVKVQVVGDYNYRHFDGGCPDEELVT
jgi:hypothetical protein